MFEEFKEYMNLRMKLMRFSIAEKMANASANFTAILIFTALFSLMFLFLSLALAFYIGEKYHSYSKGFLIMGIIYFVVLIVILVLKKYIIINPIRNKMIVNFLNPKEEEKKD
jgi:cell division protein FtsW (lipid II flippase)